MPVMAALRDSISGNLTSLFRAGHLGGGAGGGAGSISGVLDDSLANATKMFSTVVNKMTSSAMNIVKGGAGGSSGNLVQEHAEEDEMPNFLDVDLSQFRTIDELAAELMKFNEVHAKADVGKKSIISMGLKRSDVSQVKEQISSLRSRVDSSERALKEITEQALNNIDGQMLGAANTQMRLVACIN